MGCISLSPSSAKIDPNLSLLQDAIYFDFRKRQYKAMEKYRTGFHVSDYVQDCMRKVFYSHLSSLQDNSGMDTDTMSTLFTGEAAHQLLDSVYNDETTLKWDIRLDQEVDMSTHPYDRIHGECDAVYQLEIDGEKHNVIVDYKTWTNNGYKKRAPNDNHVKQINIYNFLIQRSIPKKWGLIEYGSVIYLDKTDNLKPLIFVFKLDDIEEIKKDLVVKHNELLEGIATGKLPERVKTWMCEYCPYVERCVQEETISVKGAEFV